METIQNLLNDILTKEQILQLEKFCGKVLRNEQPEALIFLGSGNNGKTTVMRLVENMLGERCTRVPFVNEISELVTNNTKLLTMSECNIDQPLIYDKIQKLQNDYFILLSYNINPNLNNVPIINFTRTLSGMAPEVNQSEIDDWRTYCMFLNN